MNIASNEVEEELWMATLKNKCNESSLTKVAKYIGYSSGTISQVLNGIYPGDLKKVEAAVRGAYLGDTVRCPVLGELETNKCLSHQRQPFTSSNPTRVKMFKACRRNCINYKGQKKEISNDH